MASTTGLSAARLSAARLARRTGPEFRLRLSWGLFVAFGPVVRPRAPVGSRPPKARRSLRAFFVVERRRRTEARSYGGLRPRHTIASSFLREATTLLVPRHLESIARIFVFA